MTLWSTRKERKKEHLAKIAAAKAIINKKKRARRKTKAKNLHS